MIPYFVFASPKPLLSATLSLFSYSYELLLPQLLPFDNHTNRPGVTVPNSKLRSEAVDSLFLKLFNFNRLRTLLHLAPIHLPYFQQLPHS